MFKIEELVFLPFNVEHGNAECFGFVIFDTIDNDTLIHIIEVSRKMKKLLEEKLNVKGVMLVQNNGELEEVKHFHLHLIPFYKDKKETLSIEDVYELLK